mmetsp:Transcript_29052/g.100151  ORF Transcript_29052/g.100151 Transcript_29052/m.100151 type:complete len:275 (-) Transcript_29052:3-827(-)
MTFRMLRLSSPPRTKLRRRPASQRADPCRSSTALATSGSSWIEGRFAAMPRDALERRQTRLGSPFPWARLTWRTRTTSCSSRRSGSSSCHGFFRNILSSWRKCLPTPWPQPIWAFPTSASTASWSPTWPLMARLGSGLTRPQSRHATFQSRKTSGPRETCPSSCTTARATPGENGTMGNTACRWTSLATAKNASSNGQRRRRSAATYTPARPSATRLRATNGEICSHSVLARTRSTQSRKSSPRSASAPTAARPARWPSPRCHFCCNSMRLLCS